MDTRIDQIITFWFEETTSQQWFTKDPAFDETVRTRFLAMHEQALAGEFDSWKGSARGELALLVLLDQFPRNMFRDSPRAFAGDPAALVLAKQLLVTGRATELTPKQRMVALLPFQHAENLPDQKQGVAAYEALLEAAPDSDRKVLEMATDYARKHLEVIEKYGRFPHRNATLGRTSTPDEVAYLATPGAGF